MLGSFYAARGAERCEFRALPKATVYDKRRAAAKQIRCRDAAFRRARYRASFLALPKHFTRWARSKFSASVAARDRHAICTDPWARCMRSRIVPKWAR